MNPPRFVHPLEPSDIQEAIATLTCPLKTLIDNLDNGQLQTNNKGITLAALELAVSNCRTAYASLRGAKNVTVK